MNGIIVYYLILFPNMNSVSAHSIKIFMRFFRLWMRLLLLGSVALVFFYGTKSPWIFQQLGKQSQFLGFRIEKVLVQGRRLTSKQELWKALGINRSDPLLTLSLPEVAARIQTCPFIQNVLLQRIWPQTLSIYIFEKKPIAVWHHENRHHLVDEKGSIIPNHPPAQEEGLIRIYGEKSKEHVYELKKMLKPFEKELPKVLKACFLRSYRWDLYLEGGVVVKLPDTGVEKALKQLAQWWTFFKKEGTLSIDLRFHDAVILSQKPRPQSL
jgi:cell division protein FtsQ